MMKSLQRFWRNITRSKTDRLVEDLYLQLETILKTRGSGIDYRRSYELYELCKPTLQQADEKVILKLNLKLSFAMINSSSDTIENRIRQVVSIEVDNRHAAKIGK